MIPSSSLKRIPRFSNLSAKTQEWLSQRIQFKTYQPKDLIFWEGDKCYGLYLIETGMVKVYKNLESGRELIRAVLHPGEAIGEVSLLDNMPFPASVLALEATTLLFLKTDDYFEVLAKQPEVVTGTIRDLSLRMRRIARRIDELGEGSVEGRVAQVLLSFCQQVGQQQAHGTFIPFKLTRQEIAAMTGARIETVIRIMSQWQKEQVLETLKEGFFISNTAHLEALVNHNVE